MNFDGLLGDEPVASPGQQEAAVLVPIIQIDDPRLVLTRRQPDLVNHPGQMSFPGGRHEPIDASLRETALREAEEEIDLDPTDATIHGRLPTIETVTDFEITPFVATVPDREYRPDPREVVEIISIPIRELIDPASYAAERVSRPARDPGIVHYFHTDHATVWGATGRILVSFLRKTVGWTPPIEPP